MPETLRVKARSALTKHPEWHTADLVKEFPDEKLSTLKFYLKEFHRSLRGQPTRRGGSTKSPPGKSSHLASHRKKSTNPAPPPKNANQTPGNLTKLTREQAQLALITRLMNADDKAFAPMFKILLDYFPPADPKVSEAPQYTRPPMLYAKQLAIVDAIQDDTTRVIVVEGDRRTGKTSACFVGCFENVLNGDRPVIDLWASKGDAARRILNDLCTTDITAKYISPLVASRTSKAVRFRVNGGVLTIHDTTVADSKGIGGSIIWITEFDQVLKENPIVVASIAGILRDKPNLKVILDMNKPADGDAGDLAAYNDLKRDLRHLEATGAVKFFDLERKDVTHITEEADAVCRALMEGAAGTGYARAALDNEDVHDNDLFNPQAVLEAFEGDPVWAATNGATPSLRCVMGVDPGYNGLGVVVVGRYASGMHRVLHAETLSGSTTTEQKLIDHLATTARSFGVQHTLVENNSGGLWWVDNLNNAGVRAQVADFGGENTAISQGGHIRVFKAMLDRREILFGQDDVRRAVNCYNPDMPRGQNSKHKAHVMDALLHCTWFLAGGTGYLNQRHSPLVNRSLYNR